MSIPQALGYATIAGMPAVSGFYTLFLPLLAFAALGSSSYLVVAADSATAAILAGGISPMAAIASARYVALAGTVAMLTAGLLLLARLLKLGFLADFLSRTVLVGFLTGVGFQVGIAVLGEMLGLADSLPPDGHATGRDRPRSARDPFAIARARRHWWSAACWRSTGLRHECPARLSRWSARSRPAPHGILPRHGIGVIGPIAGGLPHLGLPARQLEGHRAVDPRGRIVLCDDRCPKRGNRPHLRRAPPSTAG